MICVEASIGICPVCGDDLCLFKTKSNSRLVKCLNESCPGEITQGKGKPPVNAKPDPFHYFLPHKGHIETTAVDCPESHYPIFVIIPILTLNKGKRIQQKKGSYLWGKGPCFTCHKQKTCAVHKELAEEFCES